MDIRSVDNVFENAHETTTALVNQTITVFEFKQLFGEAIVALKNMNVSIHGDSALAYTSRSFFSLRKKTSTSTVFMNTNVYFFRCEKNALVMILLDNDCT